MDDKFNVKNLDIKNFKVFDYTSWWSILFGSFIVWLLTFNHTCLDLVSTQKNNILVFSVLIYLIYLGYAIYNKKDAKTILGIIFLGGFLIRAYYTLVTPYNITKHDVGNFIGLNSSDISFGHAAYVEYLYKNGHLFDFDPRTVWSFYNPPCFYIIAAVVLKITTLFNVAEPLCYESVQIVTLFFSSLTIWTFYQIIKEFSISDKLVIVLMTFLSFHPFFFIMSVTFTNDCVTMYFMILAIWYTIRWQKTPSMKNIIVIAFAVGLAMASKLNSAVISFGIGIIFLYVFWNNRKSLKKYILQFTIFLLICAPIGLFYPIRNLIKFDMPLLYIQKLSTTDSQLISNSTIFSRIGIPSFEQISYAFITFNADIERNVWVQLIRTSLFDEITPDIGNSLFDANSLVIFWVSIILAIFMNIAFICIIRKDSTIKWELKLFLTIEYVTMLLSYIQFCMNEPFICTMNYRYIPISIIFPLIGTATWLQNRQINEIDKSKIIMKNILLCGILCFIVLAIITDMNLISL